MLKQIVYHTGLHHFYCRQLIENSNEHNIKLSWKFFPTSHGRGIIDETEGTLKHLV